MVQRQVPKPADIFELLQFKKFEFNGRKRRLASALTVHDLRRIAKRRTPAAAFDYTDGAADGELSLRRAVRRSRTSSSTPRSCGTSPTSTPRRRSWVAPRPCRSGSPPPASPG